VKKIPATVNHKKTIMHRFYIGKNISLVGQWGEKNLSMGKSSIPLPPPKKNSNGSPRTDSIQFFIPSKK